MPITNAGVLLIASKLIESGTTDYDNSNAYLGVGDNGPTPVAFAVTQIDLQGTNKLKKAMSVGYPTRTGTPATTLNFRASFATSEANFAWNEWGLFNGSGAGTAGPTGVVMLNRKVESLGTKTSAEVWQLTVSITIAGS